MRTLLRAVDRALSGSRFVTRWTFVAIAAVSLTVLAPLPAGLSPAERALVATVTAAISCAVWVGVGLAERALGRPRARASLVAGALVATALGRPLLLDAVSHAAGLAVLPPADAPLRAATNLLVWTIALVGTAVLVDIVRSTRETNALLAQVLAQWDDGAARVRRYTAEARAAVAAVADTLETARLDTVADVRALASALRTHARDLSARADAAPTTPVAGVLVQDRPPVRTPLSLRLPPIGTAALLYGVAVLPYALRSVAPGDLLLGLIGTLACGSAADLVARVPPLARRPRARPLVFVASAVLVGLALTAVAMLQGVTLPLAAVPALTYPALALALALGRGGLHRLRVERRRLSSAIADRGRADDLGTRRVRAGLHRAADLVHADAQGAAVHFTLRHPNAGPAEVAGFRAGMLPLAAAVRSVFDTPGPRATSLGPLLRTWGAAMPVDGEVADDAAAALNADPALADDVIDVVAEGLLNAAKHARVRTARVEVRLTATAAGPRLRVRVISPGAPVAGARLRPGSRADRLGARLAARGGDAELEALFLVAHDPAPAGSVVWTEHSGGRVDRRA